MQAVSPDHVTPHKSEATARAATNASLRTLPVARPPRRLIRGGDVLRALPPEEAFFEVRSAWTLR